jgi:hypothetical protein
MGFKADFSFLQKLTMGATATAHALKFLRQLGLDPIVLERYSTSNKLWATKVKRLRLADLLCVRTGLRIEVRAKSKLEIKMSDAPLNPDRQWNSGLRGEDLVAFVACTGGTDVRECGTPVFFAAADLQASVAWSRLGDPKSASEGAERDRTWPSTVPTTDGVVLAVTSSQIRTRTAAGGKKTYTLQGKTPKVPYVVAGQAFHAGVSIIAGVVPKLIDPSTLLALPPWDLRAALHSSDETVRYCAAKALAHLAPPDAPDLLEKALEAETEPRTKLELAGALAKLGVERGFEFLDSVLQGVDKRFTEDLQMEAVLILSELSSALSKDRAASTLDWVASSEALSGHELRQAAVWGLGKKGVRAYELLARYLADEEENVALHAIAAFGGDTPRAVLESLARQLVEPQEARVHAAISEALRLVGTREVAEILVELASSTKNPWLLATLGRIPRSFLAQVHLPDDLAQAIEPVALLAERNNWLASRAVVADFQFLLQQNL